MRTGRPGGFPFRTRLGSAVPVDSGPSMEQLIRVVSGTAANRHDPAVVDCKRQLQENNIAGSRERGPELVQRDGREALGKMAPGSPASESASAERHALMGIDDHKLVSHANFLQRLWRLRTPGRGSTGSGSPFSMNLQRAK